MVKIPPASGLGGATPPYPPVPQAAPPPAAPQPSTPPQARPVPPGPGPAVPMPSPQHPAPPAEDAGSTRLISVPKTGGAGVVGVLIAIDGKIRDEIYKVFDGENRLGRLQTGEIVFDDRDDTISREHALLIHQHGAFGIKPLKENNPTFLNGDRVEGGASLSDGDTIQLGNTTLKFRVV